MPIPQAIAVELDNGVSSRSTNDGMEYVLRRNRSLLLYIIPLKLLTPELTELHWTRSNFVAYIKDRSSSDARDQGAEKGLKMAGVKLHLVRPLS
jgi:hypothetical protein